MAAGEIYAWYNEAFPDDELGQRVSGKATWEGLAGVVDDGGDVYRYLGVGDSVVRERCFDHLDDALGTDMRRRWREATERRERQEQGFTTTFWMDFTIADHFGEGAVKDTFERAFEEWRDDYRYLTDLVIVLNGKAWEHEDSGKQGLSRLYSDLYEQANSYAYTHLTGRDMEYYFRKTD